MNKVITLSVSIGLSLIMAGPASATVDTLTLQRATGEAVFNDPWLTGNRHSQAAIEAKSIAAATLPDPTMSLGVANLPMDGFDFNQEGMTQLKVGITQKFARGDSLSLAKKQLQQQSQQYPLMRRDRQAKIRLKVSELWFRAFQANQTITLINQDRRLFEQLVDVAEVSYATAHRRTRQQDVIRAQLELTRLDDRLTVLSQRKSGLLRQLEEWLSPATLALPIDQELPKVQRLAATIDTNAQTLIAHPAVKNIEQKIRSMTTGIDVAKQGYKPQWGINASYGYRAGVANGNSRADLFSLGVTFDLPLFTASKQDQKVSAAISGTEAVKTDRSLLLKQMGANANAIEAQLKQLNKRQQLYQQQLLPQVHQQAQAALNAYGNDDGDFSEVMRARIAELNTNIDALNIDIELQILTTRLNYYLIGNAG